MLIKSYVCNYKSNQFSTNSVTALIKLQFYLLASIIRVCYLAGKFACMLIKKLREEQSTKEQRKYEESDKIDILCIEIAGLCHDLGNITNHGMTYPGFQHTSYELNRSWSIFTSF